MTHGVSAVDQYGQPVPARFAAVSPEVRTHTDCSLAYGQQQLTLQEQFQHQHMAMQQQQQQLGGQAGLHPDLHHQ